MKKSEKVLLALLIIILIASAGFLYWYLNQKKTSTTETKTETPVELDNINIAFYPFSGFYPNTQFEPPSISINLSLYEGLTKLNKDFRLESSIAKEWTNPNENTWRFVIDPKAKFSNGNPITANDVKFSFETLAVSESPAVQSLASISEVNVVDEQTIDFITTSPDAVLANKLNYLLIISQETTKAGEEDIYIGSGPYTVGEYVADTSLTLVRNESYWKTLPYVKQVSFIPVEHQSEVDRVNSIINGEIDIASIGNEQEALSLAKQQGYSLLKISGTTVYNLYLNTEAKAIPAKLSTKDNPLAKKEVREAIYMAIDPEKIEQSIPAGANAENQLVNKYIVGYNNEINRPDYDPEAAKAKLTEAGYPNGFSVTIDIAQGGDPAVSAILEDLTAVGINATINEVTMEEMGSIYDGSAAIALHAYQPETGESGTVLNNIVHSAGEIYGQYNINGFTSTEIDTIIEQAAGTLTASTRLNLLKQAMKLTMDNVGRIPLYTTNNNYIVSKNILWTPRLDESFLPAEVAGKAVN